MYVNTQQFDPNENYLRDTAAHCGRAVYSACANARNARHTAVRHPNCTVSARLAAEAQEAVKSAQKEWEHAQDILADYTRTRDSKVFKVF